MSLMTTAQRLRAQKRLTADDAQALSRLPWDRVDGESMPAFARFTQYRLLPPGQRALRKVGVNERLAATWSNRFHWVQRALAWDDYVFTCGDQLGLQGQLAARVAHNALGAKLVARASQQADKVKIRTVEDLVNLTDAGVKVQRAALGLDNKVDDVGSSLSVQILNVGSNLSDISHSPARRKPYEEISGTRIRTTNIAKNELEADNSHEPPDS